MKRTDELKSQLNQYKYIETFLQGLLTPDNGVVECHLHENGTDEINVLENFAKSTAFFSCSFTVCNIGV
jgi:hypothetical protein